MALVAILGARSRASALGVCSLVWNRHLAPLMKADVKARATWC